MTLTATVTAQIKLRQTGGHDFAQDVFDPVMQHLQAFTDGTGAGEADIAWLDVRTVADGANDDIDLAGVLSDAFGATVDAAELVTLFLINKPRTGAANTTALTLGGGSNPMTGFLGGTTPTIGPIQPNTMLLLSATDAAGIGAITGGSADILRIANAAGAAATYQIGILARSA